MLKIPFDPIERAKEVEEIVMKGLERKYYRFRFVYYYGGIVTADTVGCCFLCAYCWNYFRNVDPKKYGKFYSSEEVARKMIKIAENKNCTKFRISGAEPVLGKKSLGHLVNVIEIVSKRFKRLDFILETNGLIFGYYPELIKMLFPFRNFLFVRISVKGWDEKSFERISGAKKEFFNYQLIALKNLLKNGINVWPAIMYEIFGGKGLEMLNEKIKKFGVKLEEIEIEYLEKYPFVLENLKKRGIRFS